MSRIRCSQVLVALAIAPLMALAAITWSNRACADAVLDWNKIAVDTIVTANPPRPGTVVPLDLAILHAAVHDAVQAIDRRYQPYFVAIPEAFGSPTAATARAARDVLVAIFPAQTATLDAAYLGYLADHGLAQDDPGVAVGQIAAAGMLALRANDGRIPDPLPAPFTGGTGVGEWRPTPSFQPGPPPTNAPMLTPWLGAVPPFTLKSGDQFRAKPPYPLTSDRYAVDYNEVKALGARNNSARTDAQTKLARFYVTNFLVVVNLAMRGIAADHVTNIGDRARLFALASLAIADALITVWDTKKEYVFWRPITAIVEGDNDGNSETTADPQWEPLINTPNYPEHSSGATASVVAAMRTLALFFGTDEMTFKVTSTNPQLPEQEKGRRYDRFSDMEQDVVNARIYQGIHFRNADEEGRRQGRQVAQWVFGHFLRPLGAD